jgi:hypothetical protein
MSSFKIIRVKKGKDRGWWIEWTISGKAAQIINRHFDSEAEAQYWIDKFRAIEGDSRFMPL